jgi:hypothetical protein
VRFGRDVTIRGRVELEVADGETRTIPDGEVLD